MTTLLLVLVLRDQRIYLLACFLQPGAVLLLEPVADVVQRHQSAGLVDVVVQLWRERVSSQHVDNQSRLAAVGRSVYLGDSRRAWRGGVPRWGASRVGP